MLVSTLGRWRDVLFLLAGLERLQCGSETVLLCVWTGLTGPTRHYSARREPSWGFDTGFFFFFFFFINYWTGSGHIGPARESEPLMISSFCRVVVLAHGLFTCTGPNHAVIFGQPGRSTGQQSKAKPDLRQSFWVLEKHACVYLSTPERPTGR